MPIHFGDLRIGHDAEEDLLRLTLVALVDAREADMRRLAGSSHPGDEVERGRHRVTSQSTAGPRPGPNAAQPTDRPPCRGGQGRFGW